MLYNKFPPEVRDDQSLVSGCRKDSMCYLGDSWQVHKREVDNMRGKYLQMNGFIADPLQRDKKEETCAVYLMFRNILMLIQTILPQNNRSFLTAHCQFELK